MSITRFFVDALGSALELGIATPDDVLRHATPDVLAQHLPRPLWSKLIAACLAAPRTDAGLVVATIGLPDLCAHVPSSILWACLAEVGLRALGKSVLAMPPAPDKVAMGTSPGAVHAPTPTPAAPTPIAAAPTPTSVPMAPIASTGSQPIMTPIVPTRAATEPPLPLGELPPVGSRAPTVKGGPLPRAASAPPVVSTTPSTPGNGLRTNTAGASTRRPQAAATPSVTVPPAAEGRERKGPRTAPPSPRRQTTNADFELDTDVSVEWKSNKPEALVVDDDLVDWAQAEETATGGIDLGAPASDKAERKR